MTKEQVIENLSQVIEYLKNLNHERKTLRLVLTAELQEIKETIKKELK